MDSSTAFVFDFPSLSTMQVFPFLTNILVVVTNTCLVSSKYPLIFLTFSLDVSDYLGNGRMVLDGMISVIDIFTLLTLESVLDIIHPVNSVISSRF